jgi:small nuclear ribonucleoprotein (snRNP)-like protein
MQFFQDVRSVRAQPSPHGFGPGESARYHPCILHETVNVDPSGPIHQVVALLGREIRLSLKNARTLVRTFTGSDEFGNFVLTEAEKSFRDQFRKMPMVIITLSYIKTIDAGSAPPVDKSE